MPCASECRDYGHTAGDVAQHLAPAHSASDPLCVTREPHLVSSLAVVATVKQH